MKIKTILLFLIALAYAMPVIADSGAKKVSGFSIYPADATIPCHVDYYDEKAKGFNFCSPTAINKYKNAVKLNRPDFNKNLTVVRFDNKSKNSMKTYLAAVNPKTQEVYIFPYILKGEGKFVKISHSTNKDTICGLDKSADFQGDDYSKSWGGNECFAIEMTDDNKLRFDSTPTSAYR